MLEKTGIATLDLIEGCFPSLSRLEKGPVAIVECFQQIPCNPCATSCKREAMKAFDDINDLPVIDHEKCNGCGVCVYNCPGLAIMIVDENHSDHQASFKIPYEFLPLPSKGEWVLALDRSGQAIGDVQVLQVINAPAMDRTPLIKVAIDKKYIKSFRHIKVVKK
jgi:Fe-S-cluster-containing hydrogenase component 2